MLNTVYLIAYLIYRKPDIVQLSFFSSSTWAIVWDSIFIQREKKTVSRSKPLKILTSWSNEPKVPNLESFV